MYRSGSGASARRSWWPRLLIVALVAGGGLLPTIAGVVAAPGDPEYLTVAKSVDDPTPDPGQPFTYTVTASCAEASCLDAQLVDELPVELEGYELLNVTMTPPETTVPRTVTWTEGGAGVAQPSVVGAATALTIDFAEVTTGPPGTGLQFGTTFNLSLTLQVPADLGPGSYGATNVVTTEATNSAPGRAEASIAVEVPVEIDVSTVKVWSPASQPFNPGAPSTIGLGVTNDSNIGADQLVIQEPSDAADGAAALAPSNPFTITDFNGFGPATLPTGADSIQVDAYVFDGSTWTWRTGSASPVPVLPAGVSPDQVGGLRVTYTAAAPPSIAPDATGSIDLNLGQRSTNRNTAEDLSSQTQTVDNVSQATVTASGHPSASAEGRASYSVQPATVGVEASKNISPERISAGDSAIASLTALNASDLGARQLKLSDLGYFTPDVTFEGFTSPPQWPAGAASAQVIYHRLDGGTEDVSFGNGAIPAAPSAPISGFEIVFTPGPDDSIAADAVANAAFAIGTSENAADDTNPLATTNTVTATVEAINGVTATAPASDTLQVVKPAIDVELDKTILPTVPVVPGEAVITSLATNMTTTSDYVTADSIVVEDAWDGSTGHFWDAFDLTGIASTQVPDGAVLNIEVQTTVGTWAPLESGITGPTVFSMTASEIGAAVPIADITGVRFSFTDADGFGAATTVTPYLTSSARSTLRSGDPVTTGPDDTVVFENAAAVAGTGTTEIGNPVEGNATDVDDAAVVGADGGSGTGHLDKDWNQPTVSAQSSQSRSTSIDWRVSSGFDSVSISDPADPTASDSPAQSAFQTFDLDSISPVAPNANPYTDGWYMRYDTVTSIELYRNGAWQTVSAPAGGWNANGGFTGYELSPTESGDTIGIRVNLEENEAARIAARVSGDTFDPYAPLPGSGVATSSADRTFQLNWTLRDQTRIGDTWVTSTPTYNTGDAGRVENTARLTATPAGGPAVEMNAADTIQILDPDPGINVTKTVSTEHAPTPVPYPGTVLADDYPTATYTLTARNTSVARASYIRIMDPPPCGDGAPVDDCVGPATAAGAVANPFGADVDWLNPDDDSANPFDRYDLTGVTVSASMADQVDLSASTAWLLHYDAVTGVYSTSTMTASALNSADAAALADVVGVSVTFQHTDPAASGGTITTGNNLSVTMATQLRTHLRSSGEIQELSAGQTRDVTNRVVAQTYDPIVSDGQVAADLGDVDVVLSGGVINVRSTKQVSPTSIAEPNRGTPVTVTLGANQGSSPRSTLSPAQVTVRDDAISSPEFWDRFNLTALGTISAPAGADQVTVAVYGPFGPGAAMAWIDDGPTPIASAALPAGVDLDQLEGLEFTYDRDDGAFFSPVLPAPNWSTTAQLTVELRETYRDSGEAIDFDDDVIVDNTVTAHSDRLNGEAADEHSTTRQMTLTPGTQELSVDKLTNNGNRLGTVGTAVPFDLTFSNSGTGYLTIDELRDELPAGLLYVGDIAPEMTPDPDGLLPGAVSVAVDDSDLVFTWPADDRTMIPGETFTIRIMLELQPVAAGTRVTNSFVVTTAEPLDSCSHLSGGATTDDWDDDPATCGTTDFVQPAAGANLFTVKGVRGAVPGAYVPTDLAATCNPTLSTSAGDFYRNPCAAHSVVGGVDDWVNRIQNAGTAPVTELTVFDQLPALGDAMLVSGADRGSQYRPQLVDDSLAVAAPAGTTYTIEVTTSPGACVGTWSGLTTAEPCEQNGETWAQIDGSTDWAHVTGFRIAFDFSDTATGSLDSGQAIDITYSSINVVASDEAPDGSFAEVPALDQFAWNQFGVKHQFQGGASYGKLAPNRVGVHLMTGPVEINKVVTGAGADYAPTEFRVDVACEVGGTALDLGAAAVVILDESNSYSARIDGIPISVEGTDCTFTELGDVGEFGESGRDGSPTTLTVSEPGEMDGSVPAGQTVTITNDYAMTDLSVTKLIETDAVGAELGPFSFTLACKTLLDEVVLIDGDANVSFVLEEGDVYDTPANSIPVRSTCVLTETDDDLADDILIAGPGVTDNRDGTATIVVGVDAVEVSVLNHYDSGEILVEKIVDGPGAGLYGAGPFGFSAVCVYEGQTLLDDEFALVDGDRREFGPYPAGTECTVTEDGDVGEFGESSRSGTPATISVNESRDTDDSIPDSQTASVTNTFDMTELSVTKLLDTDAVNTDFGPFSFSLSCTTRIGQTVLFDGETEVAFDLEVDGEYTTPAESIPFESTCVLIETDPDLADDIAITGAGVADNGDGTATIAVGATAVEIDATNRYDSGEILVEKIVDGPGADLYGAGPFGFSAVCVYDDQVVLDEEFDLIGDEQRRFGPFATGTDCTVTEDGDVGEFGESSRSGTPATISVNEPTSTADPVPDSQTASVTNTFDMTELSVTKLLDTDAANTDFGPFSFSLSCTTRIGQTVLFDGATEVAFDLEVDGEYTTPAESIPFESTCVLIETDPDLADDILVSGDGVVETGIDDDGQAWAWVAVGAEPADVLVFNRYEAGELVVAKVVDGAGGDAHGTGSFGFTAVCEYGDQIVLDEEFDLLAGASRSFGPFAATTECSVAEVRTAGATSSALDVAGPVDIVADGPSIVVATNTFDVTSIEVTKAITGDPESGDLRFTVDLTCTVDHDGVAMPVVVPGGSTRELASPNALTAVYEDLPTEATCELTETETANAIDTIIDLDGEPTDSGTSVQLTTPDTGQSDPVRVDVVNVYGDAVVSGADGAGGPLAWTGFDTGGIVSVALVAIGAGAALLAVRRRREA